MILVTGAAGFVGSHFLFELSRKYPNLRITGLFHKRVPYFSQTEQARSTGNIKFLQLDLARKGDYKKLSSSFEAVFHFAAAVAQTGKMRSQELLYKGNIIATEFLIEHLRKNPPGVFVLSSSASVYGGNPNRPICEETPAKPLTFYGECKLKTEKIAGLLKEKGWQTAILRYSSIYGPGQHQGTVLPLFIEQARTKGAITVWGDGSRTQDFVYVADVVKANLFVWQKKAEGVFNIGSGKSTSMIELARSVVQVFNPDCQVNFQKDKRDEGQSLWLDIKKAKRVLNYQPGFSLSKGLEEIRRWDFSKNMGNSSG